MIPALPPVSIINDDLSVRRAVRRLVASVRAGIRPVFIMAHDDHVTREHVKRSGAIAYLPKAFDRRTVLGAIGKALQCTSR